MSKWEGNGSKLFRRIEFKNFVEALEFVNKVGDLAEKAQHHPDISFGWGYVEITLFTHSEGKVTQKDTDLATAIDKL